ncbi:hypothetical protein ACFVQ3_17090 [Oerskovia sp. NPDC057915]|uniref:hypothetical protein n=1 Tax=Oerskovia sp. NPDC057915 TaxID=3346280 RepID=UPI0036D84B14
MLVWASSVVATGVLAASTASPELAALVVHARRSEVMSELVVARDGAMLLAACLLAVPVLLAVGGDVLTRRAHLVVRQDVRQLVSPLSVAAVVVAVFVAPAFLGSVAASAAGPQGSGLLEWVGFWPYVALVPAMVVWFHSEQAPDVARAAALARPAP